MIAPVVVLVAGLVDGWDGAASAAIALAIVSVNFRSPRAVMSWAAKISPAAVGGVAAGGYVVRLGLILVALVLLRNVDVDLDAVARLHARRHAPRVAVLGDALREPAAGRARVCARAALSLTGEE